jgi:hypothetical protein
LTHVLSFGIRSLVIKITVGQTGAQQDFYAHEDLICPRSEFFQRAMKKCWKSGRDKAVRLAEEDAITFGLYLEYLYKGACLRMNPKLAKLTSSA